MKISDVDVIILGSPEDYQATAGGDEAHGIKYLGPNGAFASPQSLG